MVSGLKEGLVECATVCIRNEAILMYIGIIGTYYLVCSFCSYKKKHTYPLEFLDVTGLRYVVGTIAKAKAFIKTHLGFCRQMISREMFWILTYENLFGVYMQVYCIYENNSMRFQKTVQPILFWSFIEPLFQVPSGVVNFTTCI